MSFCNDETPNKSNSLVVKAYGKSINEEKVKITHEELLKFRGGSAGGQSEPVVESPCKEELKCLLKETKNRLRAKSDGFDIVYTQVRKSARYNNKIPPCRKRSDTMFIRLLLPFFHRYFLLHRFPSGK